MRAPTARPVNACIGAKVLDIARGLVLRDDTVSFIPKMEKQISVIDDSQANRCTPNLLGSANLGICHQKTQRRRCA